MAKRAAKPVGKDRSRGSRPRKAASPTAPRASANGKGRIPSPDDWRAATLAAVRRWIFAADPEIVEQRKWIKPTNPAGVAVWSHAGIVCTGEVYKEVVKLTFARGAALADPAGLFNASLEGNTRRAIDLREGETLDSKAFKTLIRAAVAENLRHGDPKRESAPARKAKATAKELAKAPAAKSAQVKTKPVKLLSGGNPQIAKADGDAPVQAYIAALPGWKHDLGKRLDALIVKSVPQVRKAVKWNSPFYGMEGQGWFLSFHAFNKYLKVAFFRGAALRPMPPGESKDKNVRYLDVYEDSDFDEAQLASWVKQAANLPGWIP